MRLGLIQAANDPVRPIDPRHGSNVVPVDVVIRASARVPRLVVSSAAFLDDDSGDVVIGLNISFERRDRERR